MAVTNGVFGWFDVPKTMRPTAPAWSELSPARVMFPIPSTRQLISFRAPEPALTADKTPLGRVINAFRPISPA